MQYNIKKHKSKFLASNFSSASSGLIFKNKKSPDKQDFVKKLLTTKGIR